jgi:ribonucleoside-diphosphate reductase alpha chain
MSAAKNELNPLGRKIFLDRYALKDVQKKTLKVGDVVVAVSNPKTGQREIGVVTELNDGDAITVKLDEGTVLHVKREDVDKPLETDPAQMLARVAKGIASQEKPEVRKQWEKEFNWLLEDWKFVPEAGFLPVRERIRT